MYEVDILWNARTIDSASDTRVLLFKNGCETLEKRKYGKLVKNQNDFIREIEFNTYFWFSC